MYIYNESIVFLALFTLSYESNMLDGLPVLPSSTTMSSTEWDVPGGRMRSNTVDTPKFPTRFSLSSRSLIVPHCALCEPCGLQICDRQLEAALLFL